MKLLSTLNKHFSHRPAFAPGTRLEAEFNKGYPNNIIVKCITKVFA